MEYQDPLIAWAIANAKDLNLVVTQLSWVDNIDLGLHSFTCEITIGTTTTKGFGKSKTQDVAIKRPLLKLLKDTLSVSLS